MVSDSAEHYDTHILVGISRIFYWLTVCTRPLIRLHTIHTETGRAHMETDTTTGERLTVNESIGDENDALAWARSNTDYDEYTLVGYTPPHGDKPGFYTILAQ